MERLGNKADCLRNILRILQGLIVTKDVDKIFQIYLFQIQVRKKKDSEKIKKKNSIRRENMMSLD